MIYFSDPKKFFEVNYTDLVKLLRWKKVPDEHINARINDFYIKCVRYDTLQRYDPKVGALKTYITTGLLFTLALDRKKNKASNTQNWVPLEYKSENMVFHHDSDGGKSVTDLNNRIRVKEVLEKLLRLDDLAYKAAVLILRGTNMVEAAKLLGKKPQHLDYLYRKLFNRIDPRNHRKKKKKE